MAVIMASTNGQSLAARIKQMVRDSRAQRTFGSNFAALESAPNSPGGD
jgi:hypothetical protein